MPQENAENTETAVKVTDAPGFQYTEIELAEHFGAAAADVKAFLDDKRIRENSKELRRLVRESIADGGEFHEAYEEAYAPVDALMVEVDNHFRAELELPLLDVVEPEGVLEDAEPEASAE